jgi:hypothetical protein
MDHDGNSLVERTFGHFYYKLLEATALRNIQAINSHLLALITREQGPTLNKLNKHNNVAFELLSIICPKL